MSPGTGQASAAPTAGTRWLSLARIADILVVGVALSLPWSTSATSILVILWLLALIPTLDLADLRRVLLTAAGGLPVLLWLLAAAGMLWADVGWADRLYGLRYYHKLLAIPLLLIQFRRSRVGDYALGGFLASCAALLAVSWVTTLWPSLHWSSSRPVGIPTKDRIVQAVEFVICVAALAHLSIGAWLAGRRTLALALAGLAAVFLANVLLVTLSRTALMVVPCLLLLVGWQRFGIRGAVVVLAGGLAVASLAWAGSGSVRQSVRDAYAGLSEMGDKAPTTSSGIRLEYWRQSVEFIGDAPVFGNGTGSTRWLSLEAVRQEGVSRTGAMPHNPHNQTLAVGVQLGFVGIAVLFAFWGVHLLLFRGEGLAHWLGLLVVAQNILSSLTNSHLSDFTPGWIYVFGVGVLGGMVLQAKARPEALAKPTPEGL